MPRVNEGQIRQTGAGWGLRLTVAGQRPVLPLPLAQNGEEAEGYRASLAPVAGALGRAHLDARACRATLDALTAVPLAALRPLAACVANAGKELPALAPHVPALALLGDSPDRLAAAVEVVNILAVAGLASEVGIWADRARVAPPAMLSQLARAARLRVEGGAAAPEVPRVASGLEMAAELAREGYGPRTVGHVYLLLVTGRLWEVRPDARRIKTSALRTQWRYIAPHLAALPVERVDVAACDAVMAALPPHLMPGSRRSVAVRLATLLRYAVRPLRWIERSPLPPGWLPDADHRETPYFYPGEEASILACTAIPLHERITWAVLAREGMRISELASRRVEHLDLEHGALTLTDTKDGGDRTFRLQDDSLAVLLAHLDDRRSRGEKIGPRSPLIAGPRRGIVRRSGAADRLREHLALAGVTRPALVRGVGKGRSATAHALRHTFVTVRLGNGWTTDAVRARTGQCFQTLEGYRHAARTVADLGVGDFGEADRLIPEVAALLGREPLHPHQLAQRTAAAARPSLPALGIVRHLGAKEPSRTETDTGTDTDSGEGRGANGASTASNTADDAPSSDVRRTVSGGTRARGRKRESSGVHAGAAVADGAVSPSGVASPMAGVASQDRDAELVSALERARVAALAGDSEGARRLLAALVG